MKSVKSFALILCIFMLMSIFVACDKQEDEPEIEQIGNDAEEKLLEAPYMVTTVSKCYIDGELFDSIGSETFTDTVISMNMDGKNFIMNINAAGMETKYIFIDNILYIDSDGMKMKMAIDEKSLDSMIGTGAPSVKDFDFDAFDSSEKVTNADGSITITCKGFSDALKSVTDSMLAGLAMMDADGSLDIGKDTFEYTVTIDKDGRYDKAELYMDVIIDMGAADTTITYEMNMNFDYDNAVIVTVPEDDAEYQDLGDMGSLFG